MQSLKVTANEFYKAGEYEIAYEKYEKCKTLSPSKEDDLILSKNIVACLVKMKKYEEALNHCQKIIEILPLDVKTLYRFAFCLKEVGKYEESAIHLKTLIQIDGNNKIIVDLMNQVKKSIYQKAQNNLITVDKLEDVVQIMQETTTDDTEKINNIKKLHYLGSCSENCVKIIKYGGLKALFSLFLNGGCFEVRITACQCIKDLSLKSEEVAKLAFDWMVEDVKLLLKGDISNSLVEAIWGLCDSLLLVLKSPIYTTKFTKMAMPFIDSNKLGVFGRNRLLLFMIKHLKDISTFKLSEETEVVDSVLTLLGVRVTNELVLVDRNTLDLAKALLSTLYDGLGSDKQRKVFQTKCLVHVSSFLLTINELDKSHTSSVEMISALLQSVPDVASELLSTKEDLFNLILMVAHDDQDPTTRDLIAVLDCLIGCVSIRKLALAHSESIFLCFRKYFLSSICDSVRIRALVGLSMTQSIEGFSNSLSGDLQNNLTTQKITKSVLDILSGRKHVSDDKDLFNYAVQGMLFLSLSADSNELLAKDRDALAGIFKPCKEEYHSSYPLSQILVNVTNSYDQVETDENLKKLAEFAKKKVPEKHPKDSEEYVKGRIDNIVDAGVLKILNYLAKEKSIKTRENASRVFLAILRYEKYRGLSAQLGCIKTLLALATEFDSACQSLARIGITTNPNIIFPGQMMFQIVGPLVKLLCISKTPLQNFEALLALGNLASVNDDVRKCIMSNKGFQAIETCMFSEDPRIRLAATQCMCNMAMLEDVMALHAASGNDRVKLLVIFTGFLEEETEEHILELVSAASGTLAILSGHEEICKLICNVNHWQERLISALGANKEGITHRVLHILRNICSYGSATLSSELTQLIKIYSSVSTFAPVAECACEIIKLIE